MTIKKVIRKVKNLSFTQWCYIGLIIGTIGMLSAIFACLPIPKTGFTELSLQCQTSILSFGGLGVASVVALNLFSGLCYAPTNTNRLIELAQRTEDHTTTILEAVVAVDTPIPGAVVAVDTPDGTPRGSKSSIEMKNNIQITRDPETEQKQQVSKP